MLLTSLAVSGQAPRADFKPVTDAMLRSPSADDWINWRRTQNGWGYSPLKQVTRQNVGTLRSVWSRELPQGTMQTTPLVHGGVMYIPGTWGIQALDATTGEPLWEFRTIANSSPSTQ